MEFYVGIMSGTSMDGIDAILVGFLDNTFEIIQHHSQPFPPDLKQDLCDLISFYQVSLSKLGEIDHRLGLCYADSVKNLVAKTVIKLGDIKAIGCHGQTIFHSPETKYPFTMQIGDGNLIAALTGIPTVTDFRRMDMAFNGGGAPLAPAFHFTFFNNNEEKRGILNLGGIANITLLGSSAEDTYGFDTGPANCLLDLNIQKHKGLAFDKNGDWARSGKIIPSFLQAMLEAPYFNQSIPKSTGRELFNMMWIEKHLAAYSDCEPVDIQATLLELTAISITDAVKKSGPDLQAVYACGGGAYNTFLLERLSHHLPEIKISTTTDLGLSPQQVESAAFAWLARQRINKLPGNLTSVTGAKCQTILGALYEPDSFSSR